jgi:hypothetical protein
MSWFFGLQFLHQKLNCFLICKFLHGRNASANLPLISELIFEMLNNLSPSGCFSFLQTWSIGTNKLHLFLGVMSWNVGEHNNLSVDQYSETGIFLFLTISILSARNVYISLTSVCLHHLSQEGGDFLV